MPTPYKWMSNSVSTVHGISIYKSNKNDTQISRLFVIYIKLDKYNRIFFRQFYYDYKDADLDFKSQRELIEGQIISKGRSSSEDGDFDPPGIDAQNKPLPYPNIFRRGFDEVNFGTKPCNVTIILDEFAKFHPIDGKSYQNEIEETIVFRKDKTSVVLDKSSEEKLDVVTFLDNDTFFNFSREANFDIEKNGRFSDIIRFDNLCLNLENDDAKEGMKKKRSYAMDIYVDIPYDSKTPLFDSLAATDMAERSGKRSVIFTDSDDLQLVNQKHWLTLVFDPPQSNGGGDGPP